MRHDLDPLLKHALSSKETPDDWLNQKILKKFQEKEHNAMNKNNRLIKIPAAAFLAALALLIGSATVYAAWKYLTPDQVAEVTEDSGLAAAFQSKDAIQINEVQTYGNYKITLLGIVSGKNLSKYASKDDFGTILADRTYVVTAIENADGTERPDTSADNYGEDPFFISPLIQGLDPTDYNIITMNGGYTEIVENGVQYRIAECSNIEIFADRSVYLGVSDGTFYNSDAYQFDANSGVICRNESYPGVNALFSLPLDPEKADPAAAEKLLEEISSMGEDGNTDDGEETPETLKNQMDDQLEEDSVSRISEEVNDWKLDDFHQKAALITEIPLTQDNEGNFHYDYTIEKNGMSASGTIIPEQIADRDEEGLLQTRNIFNDSASDAAYVETYTLQKDGTLILQVYLCQEQDLNK